MRSWRLAIVSFLLSFLLSCSGGTAFGQQPKRLDSFQLARAHMMLRTIYDEIKKKYYDPTFHGVDLDGMYAKVDTALDKSATNTDAFFSSRRSSLRCMTHTLSLSLLSTSIEWIAAFRWHLSGMPAL